MNFQYHLSLGNIANLHFLHLNLLRAKLVEIGSVIPKKITLKAFNALSHLLSFSLEEGRCLHLNKLETSTLNDALWEGFQYDFWRRFDCKKVYKDADNDKKGQISTIYKTF